ncbi:sigma factor G inhibitor Gin [Desulfosporosinus meridiei]|uniref:Inhibitor of sigma-G Gin n=1 Tax=Desulfosporosinus meridiei (strain ATCC BAA-275 / DSM 13257 / KCTC 12902 / NCIMB 13706 / S10) TaxID=768704 RepID=J7ISP0_DESMD|nr:sigma factor G inhibitor Gin [Desulfosporosinus meridiei]AFQ42133.1 Inhibitor of sigma-G Gin [Desulfosporosinus meridiei DSM 13257]
MSKPTITAQPSSEVTDNNSSILQNGGKILPVCYRCTKVPKEGLYDGFRIQGMFFCSECQQELFSAEPGSPEYQEFMFLIKGIFY